MRRVGQELLLLRQGRLLLIVEERGQTRGAHRSRQLPHVPQQDCRRGHLCCSLIFGILRTASGQ